jgi:Domain of unknown function (DUF4169)
MSRATKNMADITNLRRARKDKALRERQSEAEANRRRFGRTKAQKAADKDAEARAGRELAGKVLDREKP